VPHCSCVRFRSVSFDLLLFFFSFVSLEPRISTSLEVGVIEPPVSAKLSLRRIVHKAVDGFHKNTNNSQQVRPSSETDVYPHIPILRPHAALFHERRISSVTFTSTYLYGNVYMRVCMARALADSSDFGLLGQQSSQKMCDSLPWTRMNRHAKFDAANFILGGEIRNRKNKHTNKQ